jgi:hypothetical protein
MNRSPIAEGIEVGRANKPAAPKSRLEFLALEEDTKTNFANLSPRLPGIELTFEKPSSYLGETYTLNE